MPDLVIIADDLTGATDTAAQFSKKGIQSFVLPFLFDEEAVLTDDCEVLVINTESRHIDAPLAEERVKKAYRFGEKSGAKFFYKKTDSTLRGNIGRELEAFLDVSGRTFLAFAPAFPNQNRTTKNGVQYINDKSIEETAFATDILNPVTESDIAKVIGQQSDIPVQRLGNIEKRFSSEAGKRIFIFDAESNQDLANICQTLKEHNQLKVLSGSAGLAEFLPDSLGFEVKEDLKIPKLKSPLLIVNGSLNEVSLRQISEAERLDYKVFELSPEVLFKDSEAENVFISNVESELTKGQNVILRSAGHKNDLKRYKEAAKITGLDENNLPSIIAKRTGWIVSRILMKKEPGVLIVFGGDTLLGISEAMHWTGFIPFGELFSGVVASRIAGGKSNLMIITKAGGFGGGDILSRIKEETEK